MRRSYIWAGLFGIAVAGWLGSGYVIPSPAPSSKAESTTAAEPPFAVQVKTFMARDREAQVTVRGYTEASRQVAVRARTKGLIVSSAFAQGDSVKQGDVLCRLDMGARKTELAQTEAALASARRDYEATRKLAAKDFVSASKLASDRARLDLAATEREQMVQDIGYTRITAPVDGVLVSKPAEAGGYLQTGDVCATVSVLDPINVVVQAGERDISAIHTGMRASARLATGETVSGTVRFIAPAADLATRTFRVEMEVANPDRKLREGVTAELSVALPPLKAQLLPPSALTLDDAGQFGVRIVAAGNKAQFVPVNVLSQERQGTWVTGLPETVTVITVGQDYVVDGQTVEPRPEIAGAG
jgi:multidrug efflux system membrane fusion protein